MIEITNEVQISASPERVWRTLVDFPGYGKWNPYVAIRGVASEGGEIEWSLGSTVLKRRVWTKALVRELREHERLAWSFGTRGIFGGEECYSLEPVAGGTRLQHTLTYRGLIALLGRAYLKRNMDDIVTKGDENLRKYLGSRAASPTSPGRPSLPRGAGHRVGSRKKRK